MTRRECWASLEQDQAPDKLSVSGSWPVFLFLGDFLFSYGAISCCRFML